METTGGGAVSNAMQLKYYGLEEIKIKKAINELFHKNFIIDE